MNDLRKEWKHSSIVIKSDNRFSYEGIISLEKVII